MNLTEALSAFTRLELKDASRNLLAELGYSSDKFLPGLASTPEAFNEAFAKGASFDKKKGLFAEWKSADLIFQYTEDELTPQNELRPSREVSRGLFKSYVFIAIELKGAAYARGSFSAIARQINRAFPMPVMVLFKHGEKLTIAVINRRRNKLDEGKDVLEKATLIREINLTQPHRGHLDILASLARPNLVHPQKKKIDNFDTLHAAWEQIFNVELLNQRFYHDLSNWYLWALPKVEFPSDLEPDDEKRRATGLIRLLTRLIFCWFLKEKDLIPDKLFQVSELNKLLKGFNPESETSSVYYQAILQNLFFATLNQRMGKDNSGKPYRAFATDEGFPKNRANYDVNNLYRNEDLFSGTEEDALSIFADVPFLNGGLFECLDRTEEGTDKKLYIDGFSRNRKKRASIPDQLFFDSGETADLSEAYGDAKRKSEKVSGLISILSRYKFTIVENTPIDQEIALDPELLGKVFENLLASYNEETKTTARKQTGSFYTPRPIVDYMVDESIKAHLGRVLIDRVRLTAAEARIGLDQLFTYTEEKHAFKGFEDILIKAIDQLKILDPACGSGAFPMGVLHKLVYILGKLDPGNERWKNAQLEKLDSATMREELERAFTDNDDDYGRKLYLIENCLYGVDIQPIAIQITKLRFFISLVCDQKTNRSKKDNHGIRPLPNLETKFVAANTLIGLPEMDQMELVDPRVYSIEKEIESLYHHHFSIQRRDQKLSIQRKVRALRKEMADILAQSLMSQKKSEHIAKWDPFDPQSSADFFDPNWMFGPSLTSGFDIVLGNPPYVLLQAGNRDDVITKYYRKNYEVASYKIDLYHLFIEKGVSLLNASGTISFIVPTNFTSNNFCVSLRRFLLTKTHLERLVFFDEGVFDASVHNIVLVAHMNKTNSDKTIFSRALIKEAELQNVTASETQQSNLIDEMCLLVTRSDNISDGIIQKMNRAGETFGSVATVNFGMQLRDRGKFTEDVVESPNGKASLTAFHKECYAGKDVHRYHVSFNKRFCYFNREAKRGGCWDEVIHFAKNKILVRQIGSHPEGGLDVHGYAVLNASFMIFPKSNAFDSKFLLGILNSSSIRFYWLNKFKDDRKTFPKIKGEYLKLLPLPKPAPELQTSIIHLVSQIIAIKEGNPETSTIALEHEIDRLVHSLYELTPDEISIINGKLP